MPTTPSSAHKLHIIDSHTGGEPTRLVVSGGPELSGTLAEQVQQLERDHDWMRRMVIGEPRSAEHAVGALLCKSPNPDCEAGVIFFNNKGYLGMCGHGLIGLMVSLGYMGKITPGHYRIDTHVGDVSATLNDKQSVTIFNVHSYRHHHGVSVTIPEFGTFTGDIAWGGNWFFLIHEHRMTVAAANIPELMVAGDKIRQALHEQGFTGANGAYVDHIEFMLRNPRPGIDARSFMLCPGSEYDRSPCGTGVSAVIACEHADGHLQLGQEWNHESIIGSTFSAKLVEKDGKILPCITGTAFVNGEADIIANPKDPFAYGIPCQQA